MNPSIDTKYFRAYMDEHDGRYPVTYKPSDTVLVTVNRLFIDEIQGLDDMDIAKRCRSLFVSVHGDKMPLQAGKAKYYIIYQICHNGHFPTKKQVEKYELMSALL